MRKVLLKRPKFLYETQGARNKIVMGVWASTRINNDLKTSKNKKIIKNLITALGGRFSSELEIDLSKGRSQEIFKWFLASKLYGARISSKIAAKTYREFDRRGVTTPEKILKVGWDGLVKILDDGGYVRYDFSTAAKLLEIMKDLKKDYNGDLNRLHQKAKDEPDLERLLKALGKGIGGVTTNIFLRELRTVWDKASPEPPELVKLAARNLGFIKPRKDALVALQEIWSSYKIPGKDFCDFEAALLRLAKDYCKPLRCDVCPLMVECPCKRKLRSGC
jgi:endonuclease III